MQTMSHELRTPLHGILGLAQLLAGEVAAELQGDVDAIVVLGRQMLNLVNDLLDIRCQTKLVGLH